MLISYDSAVPVRHYVYTNIGVGGDQFLISAAGDEVQRLRTSLISNREHSGVTGKLYCRLWSVGAGRIAWALYYGTEKGRSAGRKGIVYVVALTAPAELIRTSGFLSLCLEAVKGAHVWSVDFPSMESAIESLVVSLNEPTKQSNAQYAADFIGRLHLRMLTWETLLPTCTSVGQVIERLRRAKSLVFRRARRDYTVVCFGAGGYSDVVLFNRAVDGLIRRRGEFSLALSREFDSDDLVNLFSVPYEIERPVRVRYEPDLSGIVIEHGVSGR